ncbi:hypothetical protein EVAR_10681_1 [Eumeta japonica]|uniref:Uncharacterized protein n=1 Tax=Eumeta variegata TaxID=151549 RepID=A0A4C1U778_EUMVA|nr:hypothetical protein EVAR_10681_1 [Eumeta japonica]
MGIDSGDSENDLRRLDRAHRHVRFVCLGTGANAKNIWKTYVPTGNSRALNFWELPHPAHVPELEFEIVEDLDPTTMDRLAIVGPHICTDIDIYTGSRTKDKVDAASTERSGIRKCSPFARYSSDSNSSLEMSTGPEIYNSLDHAARRKVRISLWRAEMCAYSGCKPT